MAFRELKRRFRDVRANDGLDITDRPDEAIRRIESALGDMRPEKRAEAVDYLKHYANLYFVGRHKEDVPVEIKQRVQALETTVKNMAIVDAAKAFVGKYGTPEMALEHFDARISQQARKHLVVSQSAPTESKKAASAAKQASAGIGMGG